VDADALAGSDRTRNRLTCGGHVPEQEGIVCGQLAGEEGSRRLGFAVPAPDENACGDLAEAELLGKELDLAVRAGIDRPTALVHGRSTVGRAPDGAFLFM